MREQITPALSVEEGGGRVLNIPRGQDRRAVRAGNCTEEQAVQNAP